MICPERDRLLELYRVAVEQYAVTVTSLRKAHVTDFAREYAKADEYREKCDKLRDKVDGHRRKHGC